MILARLIPGLGQVLSGEYRPGYSSLPVVHFYIDHRYLVWPPDLVCHPGFDLVMEPVGCN